MRITGRYLVKPESTKKDQPEDNRRLSLIELSGEIQEFLSKSIASMPQVSNVRKKHFRLRVREICITVNLLILSLIY